MASAPSVVKRYSILITLDNVHIRAGNFALTNISFTIPQGAYAILMGKTGCGKTTLLEAICGLNRVSKGSIILADRDVTHLKPAERGIGFVPQDGALFTTMSVYDNLAFALRIRKWENDAITQRVAELAELLGITPLLQRSTHNLSGGEAQRVALGRALAFRPPILCLDEPLSALDYDTRIDMCHLLETIQKKLQVTVLHITHDRNEAERLADVILRFDKGVVSENKS